jgi:hypothetical protein
MSDVPKKIVINLETGTELYIDLTPEEIEQRATDTQAAAIAKAESDAVDAAKADAKLSAQAKLQALGLSGDEITAITN